MVVGVVTGVAVLFPGIKESTLPDLISGTNSIRILFSGFDVEPVKMKLPGKMGPGLFFFCLLTTTLFLLTKASDELVRIVVGDVAVVIVVVDVAVVVIVVDVIVVVVVVAVVVVVVAVVVVVVLVVVFVVCSGETVT